MPGGAGLFPRNCYNRSRSEVPRNDGAHRPQVRSYSPHGRDRAENRLDAESRERLLREARALSKLDHPNICRIHDYIESDDVDLLVLEYIQGDTIQDVLADRQLSRAEKLRIAISTAEVLVAAHRVGIIHRDLKPENVMLTKQDDVKVLDFGLARWLNVYTVGQLKRISTAGMQAVTPEETAVYSRTAVGVAMGTPLYMSPEQARGEELTTASDMYAFGLFLQALFTGIDPHPLGLTAREVIMRAARGETIAVSGVSSNITALINQLKQFAPADRPTAIEAVARLRYLADRTRRTVRRVAVAAVRRLRRASRATRHPRRGEAAPGSIRW